MTEIRICDRYTPYMAFVDRKTRDIYFYLPQGYIFENKVGIEFKNEVEVEISLENLILSLLEHEWLHTAMNEFFSYKEGCKLDNLIKGEHLEAQRLKEAWINAEW